jgi:hypothetical protein
MFYIRQPRRHLLPTLDPRFHHLPRRQQQQDIQLMMEDWAKY